MKIIWLLAIIISGLLATFYSQASTPDHNKLFFIVAAFALIHSAITLPYIFYTKKWQRYIAMLVFVLAALSFIEMTLRVWL